MRSLSAGFRRDPAPSRLAYRLHRLMLSPRWVAALRYGPPLVALAVLIGLAAGDPSRRQAVVDRVEELRRQVEERPEFMLRLMAVDGASTEVAEAIRAAASIDFPVSSFDVDLPALQAQVAALDPVARATVRITKGGVLQVLVEERVPAILWRTAEGLRVLDATGRRVADLPERAARADLPLAAGAGADRAVPEALALAEAAQPIEGRLRGLVRMGERRWDLVLDRDQRILLPEERPVQALEILLALDKGQDLLERDVNAIDMRNPRRPTLRLSPFAASELQRIRKLASGVPTR